MSYYITPEDYKIASSNGISEKCLYWRVYHGWDIQTARTKKVQQNNRLGWDTRKEIAEKNGICYDTYYHRVKYYGWSYDKAANTPVIKPTGDNLKKYRNLIKHETTL